MGKKEEKKFWMLQLRNEEVYFRLLITDFVISLV